MAKKDSHFIASPYKVVTEYENEFISEFNDNLSGAVSEILKYVAKKTNSALKGANVMEKSLSDDLKLAAKNTNTSPSEAEIKAGNYKKGDLTFFGLPIKIENPKGSVRSGVDKDGTPWSVKMNNDYGYIKGTKGKDGDHVDVFFGNSDTSDLVFVIDQFVDGKFDEHKVMLGFDDAVSAKDAYLSNYPKDWKGLKKIISTDIKKFKKWISVKTKKQKPYHQYINKSKNNDIEKAHNIGDIHPNGKWVWKQLPSGKYDWRNIPKTKDKSEYGLKNILLKEEKSILKETKQKYEACTAFDKDGSILFRQNGEESQIAFSKENLEKLKNAEVFTHNHPCNRCFSIQDLHISVSKNIKEMRASVENAFGYGKGAFVFEKGNFNPIDINLLLEDYGFVSDIVTSEFKNKLKSISKLNHSLSKVFLTQCNQLHHTEVVRRVMKLRKYKTCKFYFEDEKGNKQEITEADFDYKQGWRI